MSSDIAAALSDDQLRALAKLDPETIERIGRVADKLDGRSRRELLAILGGVAVGGGGLAYGVGSATADEPDGDPNVIGTINDRQDIWIEQGEANSFESGEVVVGDGNTISQIEFGSESLDVGAASDNTTDTRDQVSTTVSFSTTFPSTPRVITTTEDTRLDSIATGKSTSGFDLYLVNHTTDDPGNVPVDWVAIA